mmetsp:Transcript_12591/g.36120  ORF Transcript_12591/g.36120 Transcript_12591/m.36120 type:complete len:208 (-) Transcript_12591:420-1043(-)
MFICMTLAPESSQVIEELSPKWAPRVISPKSRRPFGAFGSSWNKTALPEYTTYHMADLRTLPWVRMRSPGWKATKSDRLVANSLRSARSSGAKLSTSSSRAEHSWNLVVPLLRPVNCLNSRRLMTYTSESSRALKVASRRVLYSKESSPKLSPLWSVATTSESPWLPKELCRGRPPGDLKIAGPTTSSGYLRSRGSSSNIDKALAWA